MKQDWATKAVQEYHASVLHFVSCGVSEDLVLRSDNAVKLLRQRDAQWKRAVKRLNTKHDKCCQGKERVWRYYRNGYQRALHDLIAAMKEGRK